MDGTAWSVRRHVSGWSDPIVEIYLRFISLVELCGPFTHSVSRSAITLKGERRGVAGAKPRVRRFDGYLVLERRVTDRRIRTIFAYTKRLFVHQFRITDREELDASFARWIKEAYDVGAGRNL